LSNKLYQLRSFITYWLDAVDQHSLHSPFYFDLYTSITKEDDSSFPVFETLRGKLLADTRTITVEDFGTKRHLRNVRKISEIAAGSLSTEKFSRLYNRLIRKYDHKTIIELGTSLGINTLYLASKKDAKVTTFEGATELASIAEVTFDFAAAKNIAIKVGNIDDTLSEFLLTVRKLDFAMIDANHSYEATVRYFRQLLSRVHDKSMIVVDDIHSSKQMERAWRDIMSHELVYGSADLYRCGILFFDPSLNKQNVILQF
jgi:predicted O-methyltransferase YrrM